MSAGAIVKALKTLFSSKNVTFQDAATAIGDGTTIDVSGKEELLLYHKSTGFTAYTLTYLGACDDSIFTKIGDAYNKETLSAGSSTSTVAGTTGEKIIIPVRGLKYVKIPISNTTGTGTITVKGELS